MVSVYPTHQVQKVELNETGKKVLGEISGRLATSYVSTREQTKEVENILSDVFKNNKFVPQADHIQLKEKCKLLAHEIVALYELEENLTSKIQELNQVIDKLNTAKRELLADLDNQRQDNEVHNKKISMLMKKIREGNQSTESKKELSGRVRELEMEGNVVKKAKLQSDKLINDLNLEISQLHKSKDKLLETLDKLQKERNDLEDKFNRRLELNSEHDQEDLQLLNKRDQLDAQLEFVKDEIFYCQLLEEDAKEALEKNNRTIHNSDRLRNRKLEDLDQEIKLLEEKIETFKFEKAKEKLINQRDLRGYITTGLCFTAGAVAYGGLALPAVAIGGGVYGFYLSGKYIIKYLIERDLEEYQAAHPTASKKEVWDGVMKQRKKNGLPYNGVL